MVFQSRPVPLTTIAAPSVFPVECLGGACVRIAAQGVGVIASWGLCRDSDEWQGPGGISGVMPGGFGGVGDAGEAERTDREVAEARHGRGAFPVRSREASSRKVVSLTRCDRFSIAQCRRTSRAMSAGSA
jgi:hypothetical protein